jgi:hypothetical protein
MRFLLVKVLMYRMIGIMIIRYEYSSDGISINFTTRVPYQYSTVLENKMGISENLPDLTIQDFITSLIKCIILLYFLITLMQTLLFII